MKMKKNNLLILAVAALGFAACSNDETTAVNEKLAESNAISFRTFVGGQMRAADQDLDALKVSGKGFFVTAIHSVGTTTYFDNVQFKWDSGTSTFVSDKKYYWPASGTLDFFAYAPTEVENDQLTRTDYKTFTVTPSTTVAEQVDLIYANTDGKAKTDTYSTGTYGSLGVPLNFRHTGSKIVVNFKNTQANLKIDVKAFKIVNVDGSATFTFADAGADANTDTHNSQLAGGWTDNGDAFNKTYTVTPDATNTIAASTTTAVYLQDGGTPSATVNAAEEMILIPQTTTTANAYSGTTENATFPAGKTYIAVKMVIKNTDVAGTVIADATSDGKWAIWPVAFSWTPGKKYTYIVDLGDGGYWETNTADDNEDLDPILEGAEIKFVNVTVDDWSAADAIPVPAS